MSDEKIERAKALLANRLATAKDSEFVYTDSNGMRRPRPLWLRKKKAAATPEQQPANVRPMRAKAGK